MTLLVSGPKPCFVSLMTLDDSAELRRWKWWIRRGLERNLRQLGCGGGVTLEGGAEIFRWGTPMSPATSEHLQVQSWALLASGSRPPPRSLASERYWTEIQFDSTLGPHHFLQRCFSHTLHSRFAHINRLLIIYFTSFLRLFSLLEPLLLLALFCRTFKMTGFSHFAFSTLIYCCCCLPFMGLSY